MRPNAIIIEIKNITKKGFHSIFFRIVNTLATEIRMSNVYFVWKWNHFIEHQRQVNIEFFLQLALTCVTIVFQLTTI